MNSLSIILYGIFGKFAIAIYDPVSADLQDHL